MSSRGLPVPRFEDLKPFGWWSSREEPSFPHPSTFVDPEWEQEERERVADYLKHSHAIVKCMGYSWCRLCREMGGEMGSCDMTDGVWVFPQGLAHYIAKHAVKPPNEFLDHIRKNQYRPPDIPGLMGTEGLARLLGLEPGSERFETFKTESEKALKRALEEAKKKAT